MEHGTKRAYEHHECRCAKCRAWKRAKGAEDRRRLKARVAAGDRTLTHGTANLYSKGGCRCELCSAAAALRRKEWRDDHLEDAREHARKWRARNREAVLEYQRQRREQNAPAETDEPLPRIRTHGYSGYTQGCRCDECVTGRVEYKAQWRASKTADDAPHGTANGYNNYGCRCAACSAAWRDKTNAERDRQQQETAETATKSGDLWTGAELDLVVSRRDLTLVELAVMLRRTRHAVAAARYRATHDPKWIAVAGVADAEIRE